ncbi:hypothetical protein, partial [Enterobacter hormaechei]|uniref:hypothetical protein n=1 Tax=Enterobacter hormaechei TaxID=158836 RepID=UPI001E3E91B2
SSDEVLKARTAQALRAFLCLSFSEPFDLVRRLSLYVQVFQFMPDQPQPPRPTPMFCVLKRPRKI